MDTTLYCRGFLLSAKYKSAPPTPPLGTGLHLGVVQKGQYASNGLDALNFGLVPTGVIWANTGLKVCVPVR